MKILGLQKTTLIDYPGKVACTIFLHGCNFRCGFCYNAELVTEEPKGSFSIDEVLYFLQERKDKLDAVCFTGGEPLLSLTKDFLKKVKALGYLVKVDTNGSNPHLLKKLVKEGLIDYVAMDIKGAKEDYNLVASANVNIQDIEESIHFISTLENYEFRTTILNEFHSEEKVGDLAEWLNKIALKKPKAYILQGFKNKGNFIDKKYEKETDTSESYLKKLKKQIQDSFENVKIRW